MKAVLFASAAALLVPAAPASGRPPVGGLGQSHHASTGAAATNLLAVNGAQLGMTLEAWQLLPRGSDSRVNPACFVSARLPSGLPRTVTAPSASTLVCSYVARYGKTVLPQSFPLTATFQARSPSYVFVGGRLSQIVFRTSVDAFNALDALFTARFGPPAQTIRDNAALGHGVTVPRVRREWRNAAEDLWVVDPASSLDQLTVRYSLATGRAAVPPS